MYDLISKGPQGVLKKGWSAQVDDYAIANDWAQQGNVLVVGDSAGGVFGFEGSSGSTLWKQSGSHDGGLLAIKMHPDGNKFATVGQDGRLLIWNAIDGDIIHNIKIGNSWAESLEWSTDGKWLAISMSRYVHVYSVDGYEAWRSSKHPSTVSAIAWSGSKEIATACYGQVTFLDASTGDLQQKFEWKGSLVSMVLSPDKDVVACGSQDNTVHFWRRSTSQDSMMSGYPGKPSILEFDKAGKVLATSGGESVTVWSFDGKGPEGTNPGMLKLHIKPITALSFASSGLVLASGARDGAVFVWDLKSNGNG